MSEKTEKLYKIPYSETVYGFIKVIATSKKEALQLVYDGDYNEFEQIDGEGFEYSEEDIEEVGEIETQNFIKHHKAMLSTAL